MVTSSLVAPPSRRHFSGPARCRRYGSPSLYYAILIKFQEPLDICMPMVYVDILGVYDARRKN